MNRFLSLSQICDLQIHTRLISAANVICLSAPKQIIFTSALEKRLKPSLLYADSNRKLSGFRGRTVLKGNLGSSRKISGLCRSFFRDLSTGDNNGSSSAKNNFLDLISDFKKYEKVDSLPLRPTYLDYQSTTPVDPRVLDAMLPLLIDAYGNPHSRTHAFGWEAEEMVETARKYVADIIGAQSKEIVFTSGATESNNMAIKGVADFYSKSKPTETKRNHIITTQIEHKCVLASCRHCEMQGYRVTYLPVDTDGLVSLDELEKAIIPGETILASIMHVNNEIGVEQDISAIGKICRKHKVLFHTDAAQSVGKIPIDVDESNIDLMSISGHKIYGPKGVGALYIRSKPRVRLNPLISGGGQERGLRSGTLPAPLIVGFGESVRIAKEEMKNDQEHITHLSNMLQNSIVERCSDVVLNGSRLHRYHGNLNLSFSFVEGESLLMAVHTHALSSGSACTSASLEPSYVLRAIGVGEDLAHTSLRFGIGRFTTEEEVKDCADQVVAEVEKLRSMSPLFEFHQMGVSLDSLEWT